jgi:hypothetical protein
MTMSDATLVTLRAWASARGLTPRQAQVYRSQGRFPGAVETSTGWLVPSDAEPLPPTSRDIVATSQPAAGAISGDVGPMSREVPPGLWRLRDVAGYLETTTTGVRRLVADGHLGVIGPYGPDRSDRLYVAPR